jgi:hypothetical protein
MTVSPISETLESEYLAQNKDFGSTLAESAVNLSIPYVDDNYGIIDGIIDPTEYSFTYTDPVTGVNAYFEHNSTVLYLGLEATEHQDGLAWHGRTIPILSPALA